MAIKAFVEMKARPGRRNEVIALDDAMCRETKAPGFLGWSHYENLKDPDAVVAIYEWNSDEERIAYMTSVDPSSWESLANLMAEPMRVLFLSEIRR